MRGERMTAAPDDPETLRALRDSLLMQAAGVEACMALLMGASVTKAMTMLRRAPAGRCALVTANIAAAAAEREAV
jgi:hypothetical protein